ncbi:hypothetical protein QIS99_28660 [Streptomyces sp. B-S-A8]|uniref:Uncharacterized protein n=1 Tax=Streptomyces solicavernae TaxID=3043614 RepID=A0ABT6S0B8_9ACTN|nr:hypothetical protein [Streptomyces sp. B-S-A8]MDI3390132.1 hypothetical protein [Streptomyces sp. B-S-A8]
MSIQPKRRRTRTDGVTQPRLPMQDPAAAWDQPLRPVETLDDLAKRYPDRPVGLGPRRKKMEFYGPPDQPQGFSLDSLEFFFIIAQFFREALPLRLIFLLIACQRAGGQIHLRQDDMATVLDVSRTKVNEALAVIMSHGIVFKVRRGVYQFNPPYSYRVAEFIPGTESEEPQYVKVEQSDAIRTIREDQTLPKLVRFPSLAKMREEIEKLREERAQDRARRREERELRKQQEEGAGQ